MIRCSSFFAPDSKHALHTSKIPACVQGTTMPCEATCTVCGGQQTQRHKHRLYLTRCWGLANYGWSIQDLISILSDQKNRSFTDFSCTCGLWRSKAQTWTKTIKRFHTCQRQILLSRLTNSPKRSLGNMSRFSGSCCLFQSIVSFHTPGRTFVISILSPGLY